MNIDYDSGDDRPSATSCSTASKPQKQAKPTPQSLRSVRRRRPRLRFPQPQNVITGSHQIFIMCGCNHRGTAPGLFLEEIDHQLTIPTIQRRCRFIGKDDISRAKHCPRQSNTLLFATTQPGSLLLVPPRQENMLEDMLQSFTVGLR